MGEDLNRIGSRGAGNAELSTDIVNAGSRRISRERNLRKIPALLRNILYERGRIEIRLWNCDIKDTSSRRDIDRYGQIHASSSRC